MYRNELIGIVRHRIDSEARKYSKSDILDWSEMAATKIVDSIMPRIIKEFCQHIEVMMDADGEDLAKMAEHYIKTMSIKKP